MNFPIMEKLSTLVSSYIPKHIGKDLVMEFGDRHDGVIEFAGLVKGASEGAGLGNTFLSHIREVDAITEVVRIFDNTNIIHVDGEVNPLRDIEVINLELILADMETVVKRLENLERDVRSGNKEAKIEQGALEKIRAVLEASKLARVTPLGEEERKPVKQLNLLTMKPILYVLNREGGGHNLDELNDERWERLTDFFKTSGSPYVVIDAHIEEDLKELGPEDKVQFRREYGTFDDGVDTLIRAGYDILDLISFFTTGEDETRSWTIRRGSTAPEAGAAIHTDFRDKFIRAEVIHWDTLLEAGSYAKARESGLLRTEGKEYVVKDGDVIEFKI